MFFLLSTLQCAHHEKFSFLSSPYSWSPLSISPSTPTPLLTFIWFRYDLEKLQLYSFLSGYLSKWLSWVHCCFWHLLSSSVWCIQPLRREGLGFCQPVPSLGTNKLGTTLSWMSSPFQSTDPKHSIPGWQEIAIKAYWLSMYSSVCVCVCVCVCVRERERERIGKEEEIGRC